MGKSGGHEKKKVLSKSEEATKKLGSKEYKKAAPAREQGRKVFSEMASGKDRYSRQIEQQFGVGGQAYNQPILSPEMMQAFQPIQQESRRQFQQNVLPDIFGSFGRGNKGSSALNQALATAATNLQSNLNAQLAQYGIGERSRQQEMQYNTLQGLYGNRAQAAGQLSQQGLPGAQIGLTKDAYALVPRAPSLGQQMALTATEAAVRGGMAYATGGASEAGPAVKTATQSVGSSNQMGR